MLLSLCMIVRDSSRTLPAALDTIRPWVDEMVVVDTGSVDDTVALAQARGCRIFHFPWCDDFAAARNESLRHATGQWALWMDSDDTITEENGRALRRLVQETRAQGPDAYVMQVRCPSYSGDEAAFTVVDQIKLFRLRRGYSFEGRIHEQVLPSIRRQDGTVEWADIWIEHSGSDPSPEARRRKQDRDLRLLELELRDKPDCSFTLFNVGMTLCDAGRYGDALAPLSRALVNSHPAESHVRKLYALIAGAYTELGQLDSAIHTCDEGLSVCLDDPELLFRRGTLSYRVGMLDIAEQMLRAALRPRRTKFFSSMDQSVAGTKAWHNLALVYAEMQDWSLAEGAWLEVLRSRPDSREAWFGLADALARQRRSDSLLARLADVRALGSVPEVEAAIEGHLALLAEEVARALECFERAHLAAPGRIEPLEMLCRLAFERGSPTLAVRSLEAMVRRDPSNASAHQNLAVALLRDGRPLEAIDAVGESLRLRPGYPAALDILNAARRQAASHRPFADPGADGSGVSEQAASTGKNGGAGWQ